MISIISFIIVLLGCLNWLCIGFFQYDIVAGLFGYQGSIFSRIVYIVIGLAACWLTFAVIKNKGRLNPEKLKHQERPIYNEEAKEEQVLRNVNEKQMEKSIEDNLENNKQNINSENGQDNNQNRNHENWSQQNNI